MATTDLPFLLISLLFLFISSSHISSSFATTTQQGQVPSSVTPKAAAVHYWHLKTRINKPLPPIFLSKLSPLSPTEMILTNDETRSAVSNGAATDQSGPPLKKYRSYAPLDGPPLRKYRTYAPHGDDATASDVEQGPPLRKYRTYAPHDDDATASDVEQGPPLRKYRTYAPRDGVVTTSDVEQGPPLRKYRSYAPHDDVTAGDVGQGPPLRKYRTYAPHDDEAKASDVEQGPPLKKYRTYAPHDDDAAASDVEQGPPLKKYRTYAPHDDDATANDVEQGPPLKKYRTYAPHDDDATASDVEQGPPLKKYRTYATHDDDATANIVEQGPPLKKYRTYAPHDDDATASDDEQGPPLKKYRSYAPHDGSATASDVEQGPPLRKYRSYASHDDDSSASGVEQGPPLRKYRSYAPHDDDATASDVEQGPPLRKYRTYATHDDDAIASDVEQGPPLKKDRTYAPHDDDASTSDVEQGPPLKKYRSYAPHDSSATASDVEQGPPLKKYRSYAPHDGSATASTDAKRATTHSGLDSNNNIQMVTRDEEKDKAAKQSMSIWRGIFFRESLLKEGTTIPLLKFAGINHSNQYFLPRSIATKIPFSVDAISKIFNIPVDSAMYRAAKNTIDECRMPPNIGETMKCVTSAEDIIDYAVSTLGVDTDIQFWSMHNWNGFSGKSGLIGNVKVVYDGELTAKNHVTCHKATFPYLVYHCHSVSNTRVYDLEVLDAETKAKINQAAAVCHLNTTGWDPDHMSFAALQSAPGKTEVCHWISPSDMVLTPNDVAAATATATVT